MEREPHLPARIRVAACDKGILDRSEEVRISNTRVYRLSTPLEVTVRQKHNPEFQNCPVIYSRLSEVRTPIFQLRLTLGEVVAEYLASRAPQSSPGRTIDRGSARTPAPPMELVAVTPNIAKLQDQVSAGFCAPKNGHLMWPRTCALASTVVLHRWPVASDRLRWALVLDVLERTENRCRDAVLLRDAARRLSSRPLDPMDLVGQLVQQSVDRGIAEIDALGTLERSFRPTALAVGAVLACRIAHQRAELQGGLMSCPLASMVKHTSLASRLEDEHAISMAGHLLSAEALARAGSGEASLFEALLAQLDGFESTCEAPEFVVLRELISAALREDTAAAISAVAWASPAPLDPTLESSVRLLALATSGDEATLERETKPKDSDSAPLAQVGLGLRAVAAWRYCGFHGPVSAPVAVAYRHRPSHIQLEFSAIDLGGYAVAKAGDKQSEKCDAASDGSLRSPRPLDLAAPSFSVGYLPEVSGPFLVGLTFGVSRLADSDRQPYAGLMAGVFVSFLGIGSVP